MMNRKRLVQNGDRRKGSSAGASFPGGLTAGLILFIGINCDLTICRAQQADTDVPGAQVLTRGPVHEAFAGIVTYNPVPGIVVTKAPPDAIEELPPAERPEGNHVT